MVGVLRSRSINRNLEKSKVFVYFPKRLYFPKRAKLGGVLAILIGIGFVRARFFWFPLHAAGYAVTSNKTMSFFWFSIFLSFVIKYVCLKQGGLRLYRRAIPFFLGLVLGEFVVTSFWGTLAMIIQKQTYITIDL